MPTEFAAAWGKIDDRDPCNFHRLEHHCADVAACFEALVSCPIMDLRFARAAGSQVDLDPTTKARLAVLAFFHDFAKLNAGFQFKVRDRKVLPANPPRKSGHINEALYCFQREEICQALGFFDMLTNWGEGASSLLLAALSHHGRPPHSLSGGEGPSEFWTSYAGYDPLATAKLLRSRARLWFPKAFENGQCLPTRPALAHLFAGTVALADQIGSDHENHFPYEPVSDPKYIERARSQARDAVRSKGLERTTWREGVDRPAFADLFGYPEPRPLQRVVETAPLDAPLLILESETGSGKTEAALLRFASLWLAGLVDGLYFAVPTRSAAMQLHRRVHTAMSKLIPNRWGDSTVLAIPGYHRAGHAMGRSQEKFRVYWEDAPDEEDRIARWSAESTRHFLSSTVAVGTIDQALLAALKVKWAHLRGASLSRSLLVVDEVHASDAYMNEVLRILLKAHLELGGHALLMSATLGAVCRSRLTESLGTESPDFSAAGNVPYPSLTLAGNGSTRTVGIKRTGIEKSLEIEARPWIACPDAIADLALRAARQGAKVLIIRNTVSTAQSLFSELYGLGNADLLLAVNGVATVHHSRFSVEDRLLLDAAVEKELGGQRSTDGRIVIGTQTLEQSLDIDADLLVTDLCPMDVLLQRIGRLHRHVRIRHQAFVTPRCIVLTPEDDLEHGLDGNLLRHGLGTSKSGGGVYRDLLGIEQTRRLINRFPTWRIPTMNRMLVEMATNPSAINELVAELGDRWEAGEIQNYGRNSAELMLARGHCLDRSLDFDEDLSFPDHDELVRTRLGGGRPQNCAQRTNYRAISRTCTDL